MMINNYNLQRSNAYCPSNQENWNRDDFWDWADGKSSVWGYFYFGNAEENFGPSGPWTFNEAVTEPAFASKITDDPHYRVLYADLNRECCGWSWWGPQRLGSNHFLGDHPHGSNEVFMDGHAEWIPWEKMEPRMANGSSYMWW